MTERIFRWLRPWWFPVIALGGFEWYARTVGKSSDAIAPPSAAVRGFITAAGDGSLLAATAFTLGAAALGGAIASLLLPTVRAYHSKPPSTMTGNHQGRSQREMRSVMALLDEGEKLAAQP